MFQYKMLQVPPDEVQEQQHKGNDAAVYLEEVVGNESGFIAMRHGAWKLYDNNRGSGTIRLRGVLPCLFACCLLFSASVATADGSMWNKGVVEDGTDMRYPADFNLFAFNNIYGLSSNAVTFQHIEGPIAAGYSLTLKSFGLNHDDATDYLTAAVSGKNVTFENGGTVYGNVYHGNETGYTAPANQITYFPNPGQSTAGHIYGARKSPVDFTQARDDLSYYSDLLFSLAATGGTTPQYNSIHFECSGSGSVEVFQVNASDLKYTTEFFFDNIGNDPVILINVMGDGAAAMNYVNILPYNVNRSKILWNFHTVKEINLTGIGFKGSILAPCADVEVKWGSFSGTLVANNISGSAELYHYPFAGYDALQDKIENEVLTNSINVVGVHLASEYDDFRGPATVGIVTWSVDEAIGTVASAEIRFGLTTAFGMVAPVDLTEPASYYRTLLLGMKPNHTYFFQVAVTTSGGMTYTTDGSIATGSLPSDIVTMAMTLNNQANRAPGFLISESFGNDWAFILDMDGDIVWWYHCVDASPLDQMCRATMSADGKYMWMVFNASKTDSGYIRKARMDVLETETFPVGASHDMTAVDERTNAYICWREEGDVGDEAYYPSVYELETLDNGRIVPTEIFETYDVQGYVPWWDMPLDRIEDPHLNAIHYYPRVKRPDGLYYPKGLYSVGDRAFDIFIIDPSIESTDPNDKIVFRLTEVEGISDYNPRVDINHGHQLLYDNTGITGIVFFNNSITSSHSYVVEYRLEFSAVDNKWTGYLVEPKREFNSSRVLGDAQRLSNGNTLVTVSTRGEIVEVDNGGNHVMELQVKNADGANQSIGYSCWRPALYGPPPY